MTLNRKHLWIGGLCLLAVAILVSVALFTRKKTAIAVEVATPYRGSLEDTVSASGRFVAEKSEDISSTTTGVVVNVLHPVGSPVASGDALVTIDDSEARAKVESDRVTLEQVRRKIASDLAAARSEYSRSKLMAERALQAKKDADELLKEGGRGARGADKLVDKASDDYEAAQIAFRSAEDRLLTIQGLSSSPVLEASRDGDFVRASPEWKKARMALDTSLKAVASGHAQVKLAGTVTDLKVSPGDRLQAGMDIGRVENLSSLVADVAVDEVDIGKVSVDLEATITSDSILGTELKGKVIALDPTIKSVGGGRTCSVRIRFSAGTARIFSGASCMARIRVPIKVSALSIPAAALISGAEPPAVYVVAEKRRQKDGELEAVAERRIVATGASTINRVEVVVGLSEGEQVISSRVQSLSDGQAIKTIEAKSDTSGKHL